MSRTRLVSPAVLLLLFGLTGCGSARLIRYSPTEGGVVAIPSNSNSWPTKYRDEAENLMASTCPNGYWIAKEEEVAVGKNQITNQKQYVNGAVSTTDTMSRDEHEYRIYFKPVGLPAAPPSRPVVQPVSAVVPATPPGLPSRPLPVAP